MASDRAGFAHCLQSSATDCRRTRRRRPEAQRGGAGDLAGFADGRGNARRNLSAFARARPSVFARSALPHRPETSLGRRLARDGGARDPWRHRIADSYSSHLSRPRRRRQGAGRSGEDDARALSRRRCAPRRTRRRADGRRRDRDLPCRHAGHRQTGMGGAFNFGPSLARSAARHSRRDRARRWRRTRRSGGAGLRATLEARRAARSDRPPAATAWISTIC